MVQKSTDPQKQKEQEAEAHSEATSKKTLSDIEETEEIGESSTSDLNPGPSPDGTFDEGDEINDAGPM
jgi:hypothetical protein